MSYAAGYHCTLNKRVTNKETVSTAFGYKGKLHFRYLLVPVKFSLLLTRLLVIWGEGSL